MQKRSAHIQQANTPRIHPTDTVTFPSEGDNAIPEALPTRPIITEATFRDILSRAQCIFWHAFVQQTSGSFEWQIKTSNDESAYEYLPVAKQPGRSFIESLHESLSQEEWDAMNVRSTGALLGGQSRYTQQFSCRLADGQLRWISEDVRVEAISPGAWQLIGVCTDITERKKSEETLRHVMNAAQCLLWHATVYRQADDSLVWKSVPVDLEAAQRFFPVEMPPGRTYIGAWIATRLPEDALRANLLAESSVRAGRSYRQEFRSRHRDGSIRWHVENVHVETLGDSIFRLVGICMDITDLKHAEERFRALVQNASDVIEVIDTEGNILYVSPAITRILGYSPEELIGGKSSDLLHPAFRQRVEERFTEVSRSPGTPLVLEFRVLHKDGSWRWTECTAMNMCQEPSVGGIVLNYRDITERKRSAELIEWHAYHDPLTGLSNRAEFHHRVERAIADAKQDGYKLGLLFIDLDHFKYINDSFGHDAGDDALRAIAARFAACLRGDDTLGRMGGDEFTILLPGIETPEEAGEIAKRLLGTFQEPLIVQGRPVFLSASIGISLFPSDGSDTQSLLKHADIAMYRAKELGRNGYELFTESMNVIVLERSLLQNTLRQALEQQQFLLHYQPQYTMSGKKIVGAEALVRWQHPELGLTYPGKFITIAEESGLIVPLGEWVLQEACRQAQEWQAQGHPVQISVNVSAVQLRTPSFVTSVADALSAANLEARFLHIELTESALVDSSGEALRALTLLQKLGVSISVDDFGTGYSSLAYLSRLPLNILKADRSIVQGAPHHRKDRAVVKAVIDLAHTLELAVIAEGVETEEQRDCLIELGCDTMQGFLLSRPVTGEKLVEMLRES